MNNTHIQKIFIANRGEIAVRIVNTAHRMGIETVVPLMPDERRGVLAQRAGEIFIFDNHSLSDTYLNEPLLIELALRYNADAIHPGYGFLSESATFARQVEESGLIWIGPSPESIMAMGNKKEARRIARAAGLPTIPGFTGTPEELLQQRGHLTYPLLVKASSGGGGKGMKKVYSSDHLERSLEESSREALNYFGETDLYLEQYLETPRHIEVQVLGDHHHHLIHLFERECSIQRRFQKIVEEAPAPALTPQQRAVLTHDALLLCRQIGYYSAGTVEFLMDKNGQHYFLEMNTRIQVEHPVTEAITGVDLVEQQILIASGLPLSIEQKDLNINGHAIETRIYAEDPNTHYSPTPGPIYYVSWPPTQRARTDTFIYDSMEVLPYFDPLLSKLITHRPNRASAIESMQNALSQSIVMGPTTNISFLKEILKMPAFRAGEIHTHLIQDQKDNLISPMEPGDNTPELLAAYLVWLTLFRQPMATDLWSRLGHKRWGGNTEVWCRGEAYNMQADESRDPATLNWSLNQTEQPEITQATLANHHLSFFIKDQLSHFHWHLNKDRELLLYADGKTYSLRPNYVINHLPNEKGQKSHNSNQLTAPIPGRIVKINVHAGEKVKPGTSLMILEAMKTENHLMAEAPETIKEILVSTGQQVSSRQTLLTFKKETSKPSPLKPEPIIEDKNKNR